MRATAVWLLLILGSILAFPAIIGVGAERTVSSEDRFVSSSDAVFADEAVQRAIARGISDEVFELLEVEELVDTVLVVLDELSEEGLTRLEDRIGSRPIADGAFEIGTILDELEVILEATIGDRETELARIRAIADDLLSLAELEQRAEELLSPTSDTSGPRLTVLTAPVSAVIRDLFFEATLALIQSQPSRESREEALRVVHRQVTAIIYEDEGALVGQQGNTVILDLQPFIASVVREVAGESGEELLANIDIPEDAGRFVISDPGEYPLIWRAARLVDDYLLVLVGATLGVLALAVVISKDRRRTLIAVGVTLIVSASLLIIALPTTREILVALLDAENPEVARAILNALLVRNLEADSGIVIGIGLGTVLAGVLAGDSDLAQALRARLLGRRPTGTRPVEAVRENAGMLRIGGLGVSGLLLFAWPEPTTRVYVTLFVLLALYLAVLAVVTSDASWAVTVRERASAYFRPASDGTAAQGGPLGWIAARANRFRALGIVGAIIAVVCWPSLTTEQFVGVVAVTLIYLSAIELLAVRRWSDSD